HGEVLQRVVRSIANDDRRLASRTTIDPHAVWSIERPFSLTLPAKARQPFAVLVIAMNVERAVAVGQQEAPIIEEREVGGHEAIAPPLSGGLGVFFRRIDARFHGRVFLPDGFTIECELGKRLQGLISADVQELLSSFGTDFNAVTAPLKLFAES